MGLGEPGLDLGRGLGPAPRLVRELGGGAGAGAAAFQLKQGPALGQELALEQWRGLGLGLALALRVGPRVGGLGMGRGLAGWGCRRGWTGAGAWGQQSKLISNSFKLTSTH